MPSRGAAVLSRGAAVLSRGAAVLSRCAHAVGAALRSLALPRTDSQATAPPFDRSAYAWTASLLASSHDAHVGRLGEQLCVERLERLGFRVVARRLRTPHGELDIVARLEDALWCFEVKSSRADPARQPAEFAPGRRCTRSQRARLRRAAAACAHTLGTRSPPRLALVEAWIGPEDTLALWRVSRLG